MDDLQKLLENAGLRENLDMPNLNGPLGAMFGAGNGFEEAARANVDNHLGDMGIEDPEDAAAEAYNLAHDGAIFRMPADATPAATDIGRACDIVMSTYLQQADIGTSTTDVLRIVDVSTQDIADVAVQVSVNARQATT